MHVPAAWMGSSRSSSCRIQRAVSLAKVENDDLLVVSSRSRRHTHRPDAHAGMLWGRPALESGGLGCAADVHTRALLIFVGYLALRAFVDDANSEQGERAVGAIGAITSDSLHVREMVGSSQPPSSPRRWIPSTRWVAVNAIALLRSRLLH